MAHQRRTGLTQEIGPDVGIQTEHGASGFEVGHRALGGVAGRGFKRGVHGPGKPGEMIPRRCGLRRGGQGKVFAGSPRQRNRLTPGGKFHLSLGFRVQVDRELRHGKGKIAALRGRQV